MYRSTLQWRKHRINAASFEEAPNLSYNYGTAAQQDAFNLDLWERFMPLTPVQVYDLVTGGYNKGTQAFVVILEDGNFRYEIKPEANAEQKFRSLSKFNLGTSFIGDQEIRVEQGSQGLGIGKAWLRNNVSLAAALGFHKYVFQAGDENGGYSWAKAGVPIDMDANTNTNHLRETLQARLETAQAFITPAEYEETRALCELQNSDDLVRLARMGDIPMPVNVMTGFQKSMERHFGQISSGCVPSVRAEIQKEKLCAMFKIAAEREMQPALSHFMLSGTMWHAVVDFSNMEHMATIGEYVGGWETIAPMPVDEPRLVMR